MEKLSMDEILGPKAKEEEAPEPEEELRLISRELIDAVHAKDTDAVKDCLKAAFDCLDIDDGE